MKIIDMLLQWHVCTEDDMPEKYDVDYSYKCNEFSMPVWVVVEDGRIFKALRCRMTTEENFKWIYKRSSCNAEIKFDSKPILWAFIPSIKLLKKIMKPYINK